MLNFRISFDMGNYWIGEKQILYLQPDFFILTHQAKFPVELEQADPIDSPVQTLLEAAFHLSLP